MTVQIELARARADAEIAIQKAEQEKEDRMARIESRLEEVCELLKAIQASQERPAGDNGPAPANRPEPTPRPPEVKS